jgi:hypothetical protein
MSDINITIPAGSSKRLLTEGKYCDNNIVVTASDNYQQGVEDGKQQAYDAFWGAYQQNGDRTDYSGAFSGISWDDNSFTPKYSMKPKKASNMFAWGDITDLPAALEKAGVTLDFSEVDGSGSSQLFATNTTIRHIGVVDLSNCTTLSYVFVTCASLETIDKLILSDKITSYVSVFEWCSALKNITIEGIIGKSIGFPQSSLLTSESVDSIISALKDLTGATAQTLTFHATVGGKLTDEQKAAISTKNWILVY